MLTFLFVITRKRALELQLCKNLGNITAFLRVTLQLWRVVTYAYVRSDRLHKRNKSCASVMAAAADLRERVEACLGDPAAVHAAIVGFCGIAGVSRGGTVPHSGSLPALVGALRLHGDSPAVAANAADAIRILCRDDENRAAATAAGAVPALISALHTLPDDEATVAAGLGALSNLCIGPTTHAVESAPGAVNIAVAALGAYVADAAVCENALRFLGNLCVNDANEAEAAAEGAHALIVAALDAHPGDEGVVLAALGALGRLSTLRASFVAASAAGVLPAVVRALQGRAASTTPAVTAAALDTISRLAFHADTPAGVLGGALPVIAAVLRAGRGGAAATGAATPVTPSPYARPATAASYDAALVETALTALCNLVSSSADGSGRPAALSAAAQAGCVTGAVAVLTALGDNQAVAAAAAGFLQLCAAALPGASVALPAAKAAAALEGACQRLPRGSPASQAVAEALAAVRGATSGGAARSAPGPSSSPTSHWNIGDAFATGEHAMADAFVGLFHHSGSTPVPAAGGRPAASGSLSSRGAPAPVVARGVSSLQAPARGVPVPVNPTAGAGAARSHPASIGDAFATGEHAMADAIVGVFHHSGSTPVPVAVGRTAAQGSSSLPPSRGAPAPVAVRGSAAEPAPAARGVPVPVRAADAPPTQHWGIGKVFASAIHDAEAAIGGFHHSSPSPVPVAVGRPVAQGSPPPHGAPLTPITRGGLAQQAPARGVPVPVSVGGAVQAPPGSLSAPSRGVPVPVPGSSTRPPPIHAPGGAPASPTPGTPAGGRPVSRQAPGGGLHHATGVRSAGSGGSGASPAASSATHAHSASPHAHHAAGHAPTRPPSHAHSPSPSAHGHAASPYAGRAAGGAAAAAAYPGHGAVHPPHQQAGPPGYAAHRTPVAHAPGGHAARPASAAAGHASSTYGPAHAAATAVARPGSAARPGSRPSPAAASQWV